MSELDANAKRYSTGLLFLIVVAFVWLAPIFWKQVEISRGEVGEAFENSELYQFIYPAFHYAFGRMRMGDLPLWNPHQLCGAPLHADPRLGLFQPLNLPFLLFPTEQALAVHAFLCLTLMGAGFTLYARSLGLSYGAAFIGGIVYAFSGASAAAMSRPPVAAALAWFPLCFWCFHEYLRSWRYTHAAVAALSVAFLILSGVGALVATSLFLILSYAALAIMFPDSTDTPSLGCRIRGLFLICAVALALSAVQWAPSVLWLARLDNPMEYVWNWGIDAQAPVKPFNLAVQLLLASPGSLPRVGYVGTATLLLLPAACFHWRRRREIAFSMLMLAAFAGLFALAATKSPFGFPHQALAYPMVFCVSALASLGADRLLPAVPGRRELAILLPAAVLLVCAGIFFYFCGTQVRGYVLAFGCVLLFVLLFRFRWAPGAAGALLGLLLYVDLATASANVYRHPFTDAPACFHAYADAIDAAKRRAVGSRVLLSARDLDVGLPENMGMLSGLDMVGGAYLALTKDEAAWWRRLTGADSSLLRSSGKGIAPGAKKAALMNYMAARVVLATPEGALYAGQWTEMGPRLTLAGTLGEIRMFENEDVMPRAYWVPRWRTGYDAETAVDILTDSQFDASRECLLEQPPEISQKAGATVPEQTTEALTRSDATCSVDPISPERVIVRVEAPRNGITILSDSYAPGWVATLDGTRVPILRANGLFRGIATPPGPHEIVFTYRPVSFVVGAAFSIVGLLVVAGSLLVDSPRTTSR